jgi:glycosyltransferase involved in cell wall biosynthesis
MSEIKKPRVMLHIIMPNQISGPNNSARRIGKSYLNDKYEFSYLVQERHAGGKINIRLIRELYHQIKRFNPDVVHLSGLQSSGFHAVVAAKLAGKKVLMAIRGFSGDACDISKFKKFVFNMIIEPGTLWMVNEFYTVCNEAATRKMVQRYKRKMAGVIHNAAPNIAFDPQVRAEYRRQLYCADDDIVVVISGRMVYDKGLKYISDAIEKLPLDKLKFVFVGDGEYCDILKKRFTAAILEEKILILGQRQDVLEILMAADIFLFATLHENLSNALLEAMAIGLPVIATNVGGNPEVVQDGKNGLLIPPMDSEAIVNALNSLANDRARLKLFSENSRKIIDDDFTQKKLYGQIDKQYNQLIFNQTGRS